METATLAPAPRRLNLGDGMILMVALAAGLATAVRTVSSMGEWYSMIWPSSRADPLSWWYALLRKQGPQFHIIQGCFELLCCLFAPLTPALLLVRLRNPRPALNRLLCQPGFVACLALCLVTLIEVDLSFLQLAAIPPPVQIAMPAATVLLAWVTLLAIRRWKPEPSWVDRVGRAVGVFWMAAPLWIFWAIT